MDYADEADAKASEQVEPPFVHGAPPPSAQLWFVVLFVLCLQLVMVLGLWSEHDAMRGLGLSYVWLAAFLATMTYLVALGVTLGFHRALTHRSVRLSALVLYPLVLIALPAGTPVQWVGNHRHHHGASDTGEDPHSPIVHGFWVAHAGWYLGTKRVLPSVLYSLGGPLRMVFDALWRPVSGGQYRRLARDIEADPILRWVSQPAPYAALVLLHVFGSWMVVYLLWGLPALPWLYAVQLSYYVAGDSVNSLLHRFGRRPFRTRDASCNSAWLATLTLGDSWHNGHHAFPWSVKSGLLPYQLDLCYISARVLDGLGLAKDLRVPTRAEVLDRIVQPALRTSVAARWGLVWPPQAAPLHQSTSAGQVPSTAACPEHESPDMDDEVQTLAHIALRPVDDASSEPRLSVPPIT